MDALTYDARGLVEVDGTPPGIAEIDGERAEFDARELTTRKINAELRRLVYQEGIRDVTILNPGARHSLGVGILQRCRITFDGLARLLRPRADRRARGARRRAGSAGRRART